MVRHGVSASAGHVKTKRKPAGNASAFLLEREREELLLISQFRKAQDVNLSRFDGSVIPIDETGHWTWGDPAAIANLRQEVHRFVIAAADDHTGRCANHHTGHCAMTGLVDTWSQLLAGAFPEMNGWLLEDMLLGLLLHAWRNRAEKQDQCYEFVEFFAGMGNLSKECIKAGKRGVPLDICFSQHHDLCEPRGLRLALQCLCLTQSGSLTWFGTPCSSFVPLCLSQSQRTPQNNFVGDESREYVRRGNQLMQVTALL